MKKFLLGLIFVLLANVATAQVANIQSVGTISTTSSTTVAVTFTVTSGSVVAGIVEFLDNGSGITINSVAGDTCGTFTLVNNPTDDAGTQVRGAGFYGATTGSGSCTVTATLSSANGFKAIILDEISGADTTTPLRASACNGQANPAPTTTDGRTSGAISVTTGDYLFGGIAAVGFSAGYTTGTGFTSGFNNNDGDSEYDTTVTTGSVAATFTTADASASITCGISIRLAGGAAAGQAPGSLGLGGAGR